jgi:hypothetical protein
METIRFEAVSPTFPLRVGQAISGLNSHRL